MFVKSWYLFCICCRNVEKKSVNVDVANNCFLKQDKTTRRKNELIIS